MSRPHLLAASTLAALAASLAVASGASAAAFRDCGDQSVGRTQCARVVVPIDRANVVPGDVRLSVRRLQLGKRQVQHRKQAVLFLAGGPGQATTTLTTDVASGVAPLLKDRDLLTIDTRGTGRSTDLIVCPELETTAAASADSPDPALVASCARRLGPASDFYGTGDVVADIEAVRQASGYDSLLVVGVSYGTYTAQRYAATYPQNVSGLVLDSTLGLSGDDPYSLATLRALPRVLGNSCRDRACRGVTNDPRGDFARTLARLPLTASVDAGNGRRTPTTINGDTLLYLALAGDFDPLQRADLPSVLRRAAEGDTAPLARLARESGLLPLPTDDDDPSATAGAAGELSTGEFIATTCRDSRFPWTAADPAGEARLALARQAIDAVGASGRGGFPTATVLNLSSASTCALWPSVPEPAPSFGPLPKVPTLVLSGEDDSRTPTEEAKALVARTPGAALLTVPGQGHSVLSSERKCVNQAIKAYAKGATIPACRGRATPPKAAPLPPLSAQSLGATPRQRALAVAAASADDAARTVLLRLLQSLGGGGGGDSISLRVAGLRSGYAVLTQRDLTLRRFGYVPDTAVSGRLGEHRTTELDVRGNGLRPGRYRVANPLADPERLLKMLGIDATTFESLSPKLRHAIARLTRD